MLFHVQDLVLIMLRYSPLTTVLPNFALKPTFNLGFVYFLVYTPYDGTFRFPAFFLILFTIKSVVIYNGVPCDKIYSLLKINNVEQLFYLVPT